MKENGGLNRKLFESKSKKINSSPMELLSQFDEEKYTKSIEELNIKARP